MKTIYKYTLKPENIQQIELPIDFEILSVQMQEDDICLWAKVSAGISKVKRTICIYGTGVNIKEDDLTHIGTVQDGIYVWHIFIKDVSILDTFKNVLKS